MRFRTLSATILLLGIAMVLVVSSANAFPYGFNRQEKLTVSVFAAADSKSDESGYGLALTTLGSTPLDISYTKFDSFKFMQASNLTTTQLKGYPVYYGLSLGYSDRDAGSTAPDGFMTGVQVILAKTTSSGLSIDLRASSMSKNANPIKWFTEPDLLWGGAGISYSF